MRKVQKIRESFSARLLISLRSSLHTPASVSTFPATVVVGAWCDFFRDTETGESGVMGIPFPLLVGEEGLGRRTDVQWGLQGLRGMGVLRWQMLGKPYAVDPAIDTPSLDVSVEAGASILIIMGVQQIDGHVGVNASVPLGRVTPYVSLRYHWANSHADGWDTREEQWRILYFGTEFRRQGGSSVVVEVFRGDLVRYDPVYGDSLEGKRYGLNILCRKVDF